MRRFYAIEGGACRKAVPEAAAAPTAARQDARQESPQDKAPDIRLRDIAASKGRASLWPMRRAVVVRHRSACGLSISLTVPFRHYRGVSVALDFSETGEVICARVILAHADKDLEVELFSAPNDRDVIAEWRAWGRDLGLPLLTRTPHGDEIATKSFGVLAIAASKARRAPPTLSKRRSKLSRRRPVGAAGDQPSWRGEAEIIAYE